MPQLTSDQRERAIANRAVARRPTLRVGARLRPCRFALVAILIACRTGHALEYGDLTFYAPFEDSYEAVIARGDPRSQVGDEHPAFADGVIGKALVAGQEGVGISYDVNRNFNDRSFTLSVWMKALNWKPGDAQQHIHLQIPGQWIWYHYWEGGYTNFYWMKGSTLTHGFRTPGVGPEWRHFAVTYADGKIRSYVNGKYATHADTMPADLPRWTGRFSLADAAWTKNKNNQTAFDELMIFGRPLSPAEIMALYRRGGRQLPPPTVRIHETTAAPTIDGQRTGQEWMGCAGVTGLLDWPFGNVVKRDVNAFLSYDEQNLYVLVESERSASPETGSVELWIAAAGASPESSRYFIAGDDGTRTAVTATGEQSGAKWLAAFGTAGDREVVEIAIPLTTVNVDSSTVRQIRLNLIKRWSNEGGDWASWADTGTVPDAKTNPARYGVVEFGERGPALAMASLGKPHYAKLELQGTMHNSRKAPDELKLTVRLQPTDLRELEGPEDGLAVGERSWSGTVVEADRTIAARPGPTDLSVVQAFKDTDINSVLIKAEDSRGNVLYQQQVPFVCTPPILIDAKTYPKHGHVEVLADVSEYREAECHELSADFAFKDEAGKLVGRSALDHFESDRQSIAYRLNRLPYGPLKVEATLKGPDGKEISTADASFTKLRPGPWLNTPLGLDDVVIPPFTPIEVEGQKVSVWNRTYVWQNSLLPVEVHTNGQQVLAAPIELYTGQSPTGRRNEATVAVTNESPTAVHVQARGNIHGIPVTAKTLIEYDGMILVDLVFEPEDEATLPALTLVMPMKTEHGWLYHQFGRAGAVAETENRRGPLKGDADVSTHFWLGTPNEGLTFFTPSQENWGNAKSPHVNLEGPVTNYTVSIAADSYRVKKGMTLRFGFIATPVRPMRDNWRFFRCKRDWSYNWFGAMHNSNNHVTKMNPRFPQYLKRVHQTIPLHVVYIRPDWINLAEDETSYYREEWKSEPWRLCGTDGGGVPGENRHITVCLGSDWQDFLLYHEMKIIDAADGDGFYHDGADPIHCTNRHHDHSYRGPDGKTRGTYALLDYRRYYKRLAVEMSKRRPNWQNYLIWLHQSNHFNVPAFSFANMGWDGEQFSTAACATLDYTRLMTAEYFLAEFHGKQFGYPVQWLLEFVKPVTPRDADTALCLALITGTQELIFASNTGGPEAHERLVTVVDRAAEFGLANGQSEFVGWWENQGYVEQTPANSKLKCSLWKGEGKALFVLGNANGNKDEPARTTLALNAAALGLVGALEATDWWTKEPLPMTDNRLTVEVPGSSWRMIAVSEDSD